MSWWQGLVLGLVQGLTEFLPVSSSGHLVLAESLVGLETPGVLVEVVLHVATLVAVVLVYWRSLMRLARGMLSGERGAWFYVLMLAVGTIPAAVVGLLLRDLFERAFESLLVVGVNLVITGGILWSTRSRISDAPERVPTVGKAVGIGLAQAMAILPGISRSGTTVATALWVRIDPVHAAEFSFLLAIPAIAGAAMLQAFDLPNPGGQVMALGGEAILMSFVAALVSGVVAIRFLVTLLKKRAFHHFAPYCWSVGLVAILWAWWTA